MMIYVLNRMERLFVVFVLFSISQSLLSQVYKPLQSHGDIPLEFREMTANKVIHAQSEESKNERTKQESKHVNEFLLWNNYIIDEMLHSGKVLFGDSVTNYINDLASQLMRNDSELKGKLRFYTIKSNEVNAFATSQGIIFITIGLLSKIENEAQLAFVLSHEIAHYQKEHSIASVLESVKILNQTKDDRYNGGDNRIRLLSTFSKEKEFEADSLGFLRFAELGYNVQEAKKVMDVLLTSEMPIADYTFSTKYLEMGGLKFPKSFLLDTVAAFPFDLASYDDSKSSHPNVKRRKELLDRLISKSSQRETKDNYLSKERFNAIQRLSQRELIHLDLLNRQYYDALMNALALLKKTSDDQYLEESIAKALYGLSYYLHSSVASQVGSKTDKTYGEVQRTYHLFENFSKEQINLMAIRYALYVSEKYNNPFMERLLNDLVYTGVYKHKLSYKDIERGLARSADLEEKRVMGGLVYHEEEPIESATNVEGEEDKKPVKKKKKKKDLESTELYWTDVFCYASYSNVSSDGIKSMIANAESQVEASRAESTNPRYTKREQKRLEKKGYSLGIDQVVFVDPFYFAVDGRKGLKLMDSEEKLEKFVGHIEKSATTCNLNYQVLYPKSMSEADVDKYNHMATMNGWVGEVFSHEKFERLIPLETEYARELQYDYGTPYFVYTGVLTTKQKKEGVLLGLIGAAFMIYTFPYALYAAIAPAYETEYYFLLFDVESGGSWGVERTTNSSGNGSNIMSLMYDTLYQVKRAKKK